MADVDFVKIQELVMTTAMDVGIKVVAAVAFWIIGRWLIGMALGMVRAALTRQHVDLIDDALKRKEAELLEV